MAFRWDDNISSPDILAKDSKVPVHANVSSPDILAQDSKIPVYDNISGPDILAKDSNIPVHANMSVALTFWLKTVRYQCMTTSVAADQGQNCLCANMYHWSQHFTSFHMLFVLFNA